MADLRKKILSHWDIISPVKKGVYRVMGMAVVGVLCSLLSVYALAYVVHHYIETSSLPWTWFGVSLALVIIAFLARGTAFKQSHAIAFNLEVIVRQQITQHLAKVSLGVLSEQGSSALAKVIQEDVRSLHTFVADAIPLYAKSYVSPLITFVLLLWIDWRLALVALIVLVVGMLILGSVMKRAQNISKQYYQAQENVHQSVVEFVQAMPVVRTFDGGQRSFGRYEKALDRYLTVLVKWYRQNGTPARLSMIILNPMPTLIALLWAGAYWVWHDDLAFSTWLAILLLGTGMAESLMPYMSLYHLIEKVKISVARISEVQSLPTLPFSSSPEKIKNASVRFEHVDFSYPQRDQKALEDISFYVPSGSFTALVGGSGAGKSTIAQLILRFWDVGAGSVSVGDVDVRHLDYADLMEHVAFVFQDNFLFSGTIADNIQLGQKDKGMDDIIAAAKAAQAHDFIQCLPDGYRTYVGERGASLSGGQRQRITIARAILQNRPILVLDEATAFSDAENEARLMKALHHLMQGRTVLMIAHRLATIQHADQILVFDEGKLVESGNQQALLAKKGHYARLWQAYQQARSWKIGVPSSTAT